MKKHIVAILIAIAVISSLLTVSVLSEEAYTPIIQSVTVSPTEIVNGGVVTFTVTAKSNAPVKYPCYKESTPGGTTCILTGTCTNVGDDLWKCEWTRAFSEWAPDATYTYSPIYVINEGELRSDEWPHSISFNVTRPVPTPTPVTPTPPEEEGFGGYNVSLCDAIVISIGNATVTDFLNATNMTTVHVSNFKGYKGENTWRVQWSFSNRLLDVYVNIATGNIAGIEEKTAPAPTPTPTPETKTWHSVITFSGSTDKTTPPFTIKGDEWRVKWSIKGGPGHTDFFVYVHPRGQTSGSVSNWRYTEASSVIHYIDEEASDIQYIYEGTGDYYFKIGAANLDSWELEVEDYY